MWAAEAICTVNSKIIKCINLKIVFPETKFYLFYLIKQNASENGLKMLIDIHDLITNKVLSLIVINILFAEESFFNVFFRLIVW